MTYLLTNLQIDTISSPGPHVLPLAAQRGTGAGPSTFCFVVCTFPTAGGLQFLHLNIEKQSANTKRFLRQVYKGKKDIIIIHTQAVFKKVSMGFYKRECPFWSN